MALTKAITEELCGENNPPLINPRLALCNGIMASHDELQFNRKLGDTYRTLSGECCEEGINLDMCAGEKLPIRKSAHVLKGQAKNSDTCG